VAKALLEKEILFKADLEVLIGPRPYDPIEEIVAIETPSEGTPIIVPSDDTIALPESPVDQDQATTTVNTYSTNGTVTATEHHASGSTETDLS
jgi:hypothetical protein